MKNAMTSDYIECHNKKNLPRIHFMVCAHCRRRKKCVLFQAWLSDELGGAAVTAGAGGTKVTDAAVGRKLKKAAITAVKSEACNL